MLAIKICSSFLEYLMGRLFMLTLGLLSSIHLLSALSQLLCRFRFFFYIGIMNLNKLKRGVVGAP